MAKTADYELGPHMFPRGWFLVARSDELTDKPIALRYFGQDMALYRGQSGTPHLVEAYCPHMGAHLAPNATSYIVRDREHVQGESIRCPFHGWRFGPDGRCDDIPYSSQAIPKAACIRSWTVAERAGAIWMWYDEEGGAPDIPLPAFAEWDAQDAGWVRWRFDDFGTLPAHPVEIVDNMADLRHMDPIHGSRGETYFDNEFVDHRVSQSFWAGHRTLVDDSPDAVLSSEAFYTGPAILQARLGGQHPSLMLIAHTPVEDGVIRMHHALMVKIADTRPSEEQKASARDYQEASRLALAQDVEIWLNKRPARTILQIPTDGPFGRVRTWYRQFYNPRSDAATFRKRVNGRDVRVGTARPAGALIDIRREEELTGGF
ncbi:Rieske 2Fe-2S domain-containing protein [Flavisphingomonas formosensis]|uniref:Rieske 2Fe-2S domain-containing protein n=1 Tax=Flavisphingomonas formosensis TaxID=861534 RepID=UPI0012FB7C00|nr:Rieske 2Fe-2S domain-containing protein [Sphingomonas formosensis]